MLTTGAGAQTYTWVESGRSFTDGTLLYTLGSYNDSKTTTVSLGSQEVAVSLYLTNSNTDQLTDVINDDCSAYQNLSWWDKSSLDYLGIGYSTKIGEITYMRLENGRGGRKRWRRTYSASKIGTNKTAEVTIPTTVTFNGTVYTIVAIPYLGFSFPDYSTEEWRDYCGNGGTNVTSHLSYCIEGGNTYLTTVHITTDSQIRDIGAYAFGGCTHLQSVLIPRTVETLKNGAFRYCFGLETVTFQTENTSQNAALRTIESYVFYGDWSIKKLYFPEGLQTIGDYVLIYNFALEDMGAHFLCDASSLKELTVPASVKYINGAFLHGCESLESVYMLGYAEYLDLETSQKDGQAFDYNHSYCKERVSTCTFYVPENFLEQYQQHDVWRLIDDDGRYGSITDKTNQTHVAYGNTLTILPGTEREFKAEQWTTAIFPKGVSGYKSIFGQGSRFAEYVSVERVDDETDPQSGKRIRMYRLHFRIIEGDDIPAGVPGMFYPALQKTYKLWDKADETIEFTEDMSKPHTGSYGYTATNDPDEAYVFISGYYVPTKLQEWDFYLSANTNKFMRVRAGNEPTAGVCRCFWTVKIDGLPAEASAGARQGFLDDELTGIVTMTLGVEEEAGEVYDLGGRRVNGSKGSLKGGVYVVNGKKMVKR